MPLVLKQRTYFAFEWSPIMLILGRRANQSIVFPNCGITVRILGVNGRVAKVGIEAPRSVEIMRGELATATHSASKPTAGSYEHEVAPESGPELLQFAQRLADIKTSLHTFQQLRASGDEAKADVVLAELLEDLANLDKDWLESESMEIDRTRRGSSEMVSESSTHYVFGSPASTPPIYLLIVNAPSTRVGFDFRAGTFHGCQVCEVNSLSAAKNAIANGEHFDIIVCNGDPNTNDNIALTKAIRENHEYDRTRVFVTSDSNSIWEQLKNAGQSGVDAWLNQPLSPQDLWNHIVESNQLEL